MKTRSNLFVSCSLQHARKRCEGGVPRVIRGVCFQKFDEVEETRVRVKTGSGEIVIIVDDLGSVQFVNSIEASLS
jgi:hypothetical protein